MSKPRFELNLKGLEQLMSSAEMESGLEKIAQEIVDDLGEGYEYKISQGTKAKINRKTVFINTATKEGEQDNLENNTILRKLQG